MNLPSAMVIYRLTQVLDLPADALFAPQISQAQAVVDADALFITIGPRELPVPLIDACRDIMAAFHALEDICQVQKHARLPMSIPFEPDYKGMEELADAVRNCLGIKDAVVFDYFELFENFGLRILVFPFTNQAKDFDAVSFYEPGHQNAFFFLNAGKNPEKQLFSLALELGKILIFNQIKTRKDHAFFDTSSLGQDRPITELRAAKHFAATFLMPEAAVRTTVGQLGIRPPNWSWDLILRIKHRFGISTESFLYRLIELNLISGKTANNIASKIKTYYNETQNKEPGASKRILSPNGRFFDLFHTASTIDPREAKDIHEIVAKYKILNR